MPKIPMAEPRSCGGNSWNMIIIAVGCTMPAAAPWSTRARMRMSSSGATPPRTDPTVNRISAIVMVLR
jgi:hypothetical protein